MSEGCPVMGVTPTTEIPLALRYFQSPASSTTWNSIALGTTSIQASPLTPTPMAATMRDGLEVWSLWLTQFVDLKLIAILPEPECVKLLLELMLSSLLFLMVTICLIWMVPQLLLRSCGAGRRLREESTIFGATSTIIILVEAGCGLRLPQVETAFSPTRIQSLVDDYDFDRIIHNR